jgi:hypothetical protein
MANESGATGQQLAAAWGGARSSNQADVACVV